MRMKILLFTLSVIVLASCSTAYKSGQTPDDLYYVKAKPAVSEKTEDYDRTSSYSYEDRQVRMGIYDKRWRDLDYDYDYDYRYNPYAYGYTYGYYYNPYYYPYPVYSGVTFVNPKNTTIRTTNLNSYTNTVSTSSFVKGYAGVQTTPVGRYNNSNRSTNTRADRTNVYDTRTYTPERSNTSSSNNSSSSGSSSSSSTPSSSGSTGRPGRN